jgi:flagellar biosynthesis protein FlhG
LQIDVFEFERIAMLDQASELRRLVLRSMRERSAANGPPPRLLVLAGGKGGVGVTTLAVNLSVALAEQGARVVLVDADLHRSDVAAFCGVSEHQSVADVLIARRDIHEVLQRGPAGVQIVPGLWAPGDPIDGSQMAQERLLRQFKTLGPHADCVVLDVGSGTGTLIRQFCSAADDILLVTTADTVSVMDTYARVKTSVKGAGEGVLRLVVNQCPDANQAAEVFGRIDTACQRFLGLRASLLGYIPEDTCVRQAASDTRPFMVATPTCEAARAMHQLATSLVSTQPATMRHVA